MLYSGEHHGEHTPPLASHRRPDSGLGDLALPVLPIAVESDATSMHYRPERSITPPFTGKYPRYLFAGGRPSGIDSLLGKQFKFVKFLLEDPDHRRFVEWNEAGDVFVVFHTDEFAETVLPKYFKHSKFPSFVRQLNIYGFYRVSDARKSPHVRSKEACVFSHRYFLRGRKDLLPAIRRKVPKKLKSQDDSGNESNGPSRALVPKKTKIARIINKPPPLTGIGKMDRAPPQKEDVVKLVQAYGDIHTDMKRLDDYVETSIWPTIEGFKESMQMHGHNVATVQDYVHAIPYPEVEKVQKANKRKRKSELSPVTEDLLSKQSRFAPTLRRWEGPKLTHLNLPPLVKSSPLIMREPTPVAEPFYISNSIELLPRGVHNDDGLPKLSQNDIENLTERYDMDPSSFPEPTTYEPNRYSPDRTPESLRDASPIQTEEKIQSAKTTVSPVATTATVAPLPITAPTTTSKPHSAPPIIEPPSFLTTTLSPYHWSAPSSAPIYPCRTMYPSQDTCCQCSEMAPLPYPTAWRSPVSPPLARLMPYRPSFMPQTIIPPAPYQPPAVRNLYTDRRA
ncbi:hypothetical protein SpCBS45565_g02386 [Spizellomyces sp. 'palustris']|nr:hypothetical protein SpCBS45565_g02386 [Spizellomyces sp. 'palustris']